MDLLLGLAGLTGLSALLQSKTLPSEKDYQKAIATLATKPDDPSANLIAGKYAVFVLNDFQFGLQHLAKGSDKTLSTLAAKELDDKNLDTPEKQVGMGDEWVLAAKKFPALTTQFYDRASEWYAKAWPRLTDLWKMKVREQGKKLATSRPPGVAKKPFPTGWVQNTGSQIDGARAHTGSYSARLVEMDPQKPAGEHLFFSDPIPVAGRKSIEVSAYAMSDGTEGPTDGIFIYIFNQDGAGVGTWFGLMPPDLPIWKKYTIKKEIPENIVFVKVGGTKRSKNGSVWFDDFSATVDGVETLKNGSFEQK